MGIAITVDGSRPIALDEVDPAAVGDLTEAKTRDRLAALSAELRELQELLYAAEINGVLVVLQGMDAAGKDVTIGNVFAAATPEAVRVTHFTSMTEDEEAHDFLWRAHAHTPKVGEVVIFDRSYYEQVVLPQVEEATTDAETADRVADVVAFEQILTHGGTIVVKFFLHVSPEEQHRRLVERMEDPASAWKISANDWVARRKWDRYMEAYERTINATATPDAPWYVVPADRPWFHNLAVAEALVGRLRQHREAWTEARERIGREKRAEAEAAARDS